MRAHVKRTGAPIIAGLLLLLLMLPQLAVVAGPEISGVVVLDKTFTTATITWTVTTNSTITENRVNYGTTPILGQTVYDNTNVANPQILITGLTPNTKYYFEVRSTDASGPSTDNNNGELYSFTTPAPPAGYYSITLEPTCGVCGELIEVGICGEVIGVTVVVAEPGTYHISWDSTTNVKETFTVDEAGSYSLAIYTPEATKGDHTVYLTDNTYTSKASATFTVNPSAKIDPARGPVGTTVTLNGYGFTASQEIQVKFKDTVIQTTTANAVGSWTVTYTIPDTPGGGYIFAIEAKEGTVFVNFVSKDFEVTPQIVVTPTTGIVGQPVNVDGTGFASEEANIKITFDGKVVKEHIFADPDGSWSTSIAIPLIQSGRYIIDASGVFTRARNVPDVTFTVVPGISVEPTVGYVGDTITIKGGGFAPGETGIQVYFDQSVVASVAPADIYGSWQSSFALPVSTYGSHTVSASGIATQPAVTTTLSTLAKITGINPVEGAPGDSVTVTGTGFHGSEQLTVTLGTVVPGSLFTQVNGNVAISFRVPANTPGLQTVTVTDTDGATGSVNFTVTDKTLATPSPVSPTDSTLRSGEATFDWQGLSAENGITYTYSLEISQSASFGNIVRSNSGVAGNSYTLTKEEALTKGTYYWRAKATDNYGNESSWSASAKFTVSPIPTWVWVVLGLVVLVVLMVVAYRETKFRVTE